MNSFESNEFLHLHKTFGGFKTKKNTCIDINNAIKKDSVSKQARVKQSSFAKKNRVRLNENIESRFMLEAQKNTSTRLTDKKNKFLENKRLSKAK